MTSESIKGQKKRKNLKYNFGNSRWRISGLLLACQSGTQQKQKERELQEITGSSQPFRGWINYGVLPFFSGKNFFQRMIPLLLSSKCSDFPGYRFLSFLANILEDKILFLDLDLIIGFSPTPSLLSIAAMASLDGYQISSMKLYEMQRCPFASHSLHLDTFCKFYEVLSTGGFSWSMDCDFSHSGHSSKVIIINQL